MKALGQGHLGTKLEAKFFFGSVHCADMQFCKFHPKQVLVGHRPNSQQSQNSMSDISGTPFCTEWQGVWDWKDSSIIFQKWIQQGAIFHLQHWHHMCISFSSAPWLLPRNYWRLAHVLGHLHSCLRWGMRSCWLFDSSWLSSKHYWYWWKWTSRWKNYFCVCFLLGKSFEIKIK